MAWHLFYKIDLRQHLEVMLLAFLPFEPSPGDDGQMWWAHARPHKQHHILVTRVAVRHHLTLEGLELVLVVALDVNQADGHLAVPASVENFAEAPLADHLPDLQLLEWYVPLLQEDAGLAGLAWEVASRQERQVHLLKLVTGVLIVALLILWKGTIKMVSGGCWPEFFLDF